MGNVIDFHSRRELHLLNDEHLVALPQTGEEYLQICKDTLPEQDYKNILCAIMDGEYYVELQDQMKKVVDSYYSFYK